MLGQDVYSVSDVNRIIKKILDNDYKFANIQVQGEISNFRRYSSGHCYFTLKDKTGVLKAVMFKGKAFSLKFQPKDGDTVLAIGRLSVYERDGIYQLYVDIMLQVGAGDLMVAYEALKQKLEADGLFAIANKKSLPLQPQTIGVITSPSGAAVHDIITVSRRRNPGIKILLYPVKVQGAEASKEIVQAIKFMNSHKLAEVLIVGRGGGSIEDLWSFNEECVVRAIANSQIPVVAAVGHETDFTLSDFAADKRAATPSQAAELVVNDVAAQMQHIKNLKNTNFRIIKNILAKKKVQVQTQALSQVLVNPDRWLGDRKQRVDFAVELLLQKTKFKLQETRHKQNYLVGKLDSLSPLAIMGRGYSYTENDSGQIIKSINEIETNKKIKTTLQDGYLVSQITEIGKAVT